MNIFEIAFKVVAVVIELILTIIVSAIMAIPTLIAGIGGLLLFLAPVACIVGFVFLIAIWF